MHVYLGILEDISSNSPRNTWILLGFTEVTMSNLPTVIAACDVSVNFFVRYLLALLFQTCQSCRWSCHKIVGRVPNCHCRTHSYLIANTLSSCLSSEITWNRILIPYSGFFPGLKFFGFNLIIFCSFNFCGFQMPINTKIHCKNIRRFYGKITGDQLPVHFPLFFTDARKHFQ